MRTILRSSILIATIVVTDVPAAASEPETLARVSVVFVKPEGFTDVRYSKTERNSPAILLQLQRFILDTAARYLPESMRLEVKITDIDLAGDFELFRGPQFDHVRVIKSIYPPRIALSSASSTPAIKPSKKVSANLPISIINCAATIRARIHCATRRRFCATGCAAN